MAGMTVDLVLESGRTSLRWIFKPLPPAGRSNFHYLVPVCISGNNFTRIFLQLQLNGQTISRLKFHSDRSIEIGRGVEMKDLP
jgi:hypothetical protein